MSEILAESWPPSSWKWEPLAGEISYESFRAAGPGGQNVNKVSTAVRLRLDVFRSPTIPDPVKRRLAEIAGRRMNAEGILHLVARRARSQEANRQAALDRLERLVAAASVPASERKATGVPGRQRKARLAAKRRRAEAKRRRRVGTADVD